MSPSPRRSPMKDASPDAIRSPALKSVSPHGRRGDSRSPSPRSDADVSCL